jgi:hypothetical protein
MMTKEYITFGDNGKGRVLSVGTVKVSESVTLRRVLTVNFRQARVLVIHWFRL